MMSPSIDRRSYHVYECEGDKLLFDRASESLFVIDPSTFDLLRDYENQVILGLPPEVEEFLLELQEKGMFQFRPVSEEGQQEAIRHLLSHNSVRLQLLMAQGCNLGCRYCYAWRNGSNQKGTLMEWDQLKTSIDFAVTRSGPREKVQITFFGGEPLLNYPMVKKAVAYCRLLQRKTTKQFSYEIITNAVLLTPTVARFLARHRFLLMVSMDGWKEMHDYNRPSLNGKSDHALILEHAQYANQLYIERGLGPIKVRANLTNKYHDAEAVANYMHEQGFTKLGLATIEPLPHSAPSPSAVSHEQLLSLDEKGFQRAKVSIAALSEGGEISAYQRKSLTEILAPTKKSGIKGLGCGVGRNTAIVDNKGNIYPCHRYEGMPNYVIGNVATGMDKVKLKDYYDKVNQNARARCHDCWIRDYCNGGCAWLLSEANKRTGLSWIRCQVPRPCGGKRKANKRTGLSWIRRCRARRCRWPARCHLR